MHTPYSPLAHNENQRAIVLLYRFRRSHDLYDRHTGLPLQQPTRWVRVATHRSPKKHGLRLETSQSRNAVGISILRFLSSVCVRMMQRSQSYWTLIWSPSLLIWADCCRNSCESWDSTRKSILDCRHYTGGLHGSVSISLVVTPRRPQFANCLAPSTVQCPRLDPLVHCKAACSL